MAIDTKIVSSNGDSAGVTVTKRGQLVTSPLAFSTAYNATAGVTNTGYNLVTPVTAKQFIITSIHLYANKNVGAGDATVVLYEASDATTATADKTIFTVEMVKQTSRDLTGLNLEVSEGKWVNVKTDDDDVFATLLGYYVPALS
jgi:hypothetical protein